MKQTLVMTTMLLAAQAVMAEPELSGTPSDLTQHLSGLPGQVTISGSAERRVEADRAVVAITVRTSEKQLRPAMEQNRKLRAEIVVELTGGGVDEARIHTSRFASTPAHSSWTGKVKEYHISSTIRVDAESEDEVQQVAGLVDKLDEVTLSSLEFELTDRDEITSELLKEAFLQLGKRRELYESSLGVILRPRQVGMPRPKKSGDRHAQWPQQDGSDILSIASVLTNPELTMTLHALEQRPPELNQFEELLLKVGVVVTFDLVPQNR